MRTISKRTQYGLKAMLALARRYREKPVLIATLAKEESIPTKFLEAILTQLRRASQNPPSGPRPRSHWPTSSGPSTGRWSTSAASGRRRLATAAWQSHCKRSGSRCARTSGPSWKRSRWRTWSPVTCRCGSGSWPTTRGRGRAAPSVLSQHASRRGPGRAVTVRPGPCRSDR